MSILRNQIEIRFYCMVKGFLRLKGVFPVLLLSLTAFFPSCEKESVPDGVLTKDQMVHLLIDFYVAEEKVNSMKLPADSSKALFELMEQKVLEKSAVEDSVFFQSFNYYIDRPKEMEQIYTAIVDSLQLMEQRASEIKDP
jgi:hypothetical protein